MRYMCLISLPKRKGCHQAPHGVEDAGCLFDLGFQAQVRVLSLDVGTAGRLQLRHALIGAAHVHVACLRTLSLVTSRVTVGELLRDAAISRSCQPYTHIR
jgi:hypothetical protein